MVTIDKRNPLPYYEQLAELLRREIGARQAAGEVYPLPSENELAEQHGISRATVRHALDELEREGFIYRQKGVGSFAPVRRVEQDLTQLVSTSEAMSQRGWSLVTRVLSLEQLEAAPHVSRALELPSGSAVYALCRLRVVDDVPLSVQTNYLPAVLCPRLEEADLTGSLYHLLESRYGLRLWNGREVLRARAATPHEASLLDTRDGTPVMYAERTTYVTSGAPVEYLEAVWRGDRYDFTVTLTRPAG
jgi:GntR family transcriptional regulator